MRGCELNTRSVGAVMYDGGHRATMDDWAFNTEF